MTGEQNIVGPQIRKIRYAKGWTQDMLAAKLATVAKWDISRGMLSKIEAGLRCVTDAELLCFSKVLKVEIRELYPNWKS